MAEGGEDVPIDIETEMKTAYIDYSMSVMVSRALPDVRDGLKPVHRRVLYGMSELGVASNRPYKKSARIVGDVLGKYHPHGDSGMYDAMVRMAQPWSLRYPLVDGQGNFGSMDGDNPAAMRYTEVRMRTSPRRCWSIWKRTRWTFVPNFDDSLEEPTVLPSRIPNLLDQRRQRYRRGHGHQHAPHNLPEVVDGIIAYIDNRDITTVEELMQHVKAPDFPTGGIIYGYDGVSEALITGRGPVIVRGKSHHRRAQGTSREHIIVTEIPYQVNKAELHEKMADLVNDKKMEGIWDIARTNRPQRHPSGRIDLKKGRHQQRGAEPVVQIHAVADQLRREQHCVGEWPPASACTQGHDSAFCRAPARGRRPPDAI